MAPPHPFQYTPCPYTLHGPTGSSTEGSSGCVRMAPPKPISAHPSHASWPHTELHRRPQRL
eukprot:6394000-Pyramimonas_sp.AAC.1